MDTIMTIACMNIYPESLGRASQQHLIYIFGHVICVFCSKHALAFSGRLHRCEFVYQAHTWQQTDNEAPTRNRCH